MNKSANDRLDYVNFAVSPIESQDYYHKCASKYNEDCENVGYTGPLKLAERVACQYSATSHDSVHILDVGAGTGLVAAEMRSLGFTSIDALEPNESMLNEAKKSNLYQNYFVEYLTESPTSLPANTYDTVTGCCIYGEYGLVPCEALYEMIRLVKPGGYIFLATRPELTESNGRHSQLEPLMDKLETDGKWRRVSREVFPGLRLGKDGVMWCYEVL